MNIHEVKKKYLKDHVYLYKNLFSKKDFQELDGVFRVYLEKFFNYKTQSKNFVFQNKNCIIFCLEREKTMFICSENYIILSKFHLPYTDF